MKPSIRILNVALLFLPGCAFFGGEKIYTPPTPIRYQLASDCYIVKDMDLNDSCQIIGETEGHSFHMKGLPDVVSKASIGKQYGPYTVAGIINRGDIISVVGIKIGDSFEMGTFRIPIVTILTAHSGCSRFTGAEIANRSTGDIRPEIATRLPE